MTISSYHYALLLFNFCFSSTGQVTIEFYVDKETNFIVFHSKNLTITEKVRNIKISNFVFLFSFFFLLIFKNQFSDGPRS